MHGAGITAAIASASTGMPLGCGNGPLQVTPRLGAWPLHSRHASRAMEAHHLAGLPPHSLMQRAGLALARLALAVAPAAPRMWVAAGPGNNGGDGLLAAMHLHRLGLEVNVSLVAGNPKPGTDAAWALEQAQAQGVAIWTNTEPPVGTALCIDALLGLGSNRAPLGPVAAAIASMHSAGIPILAVDLPSGLDPDTGQPFGLHCVRATHTLSLLSLKPGLFTGVGRDHAGQIWLDALNTPLHEWPASGYLCGGHELARTQLARQHASHKGSHGEVLVVGGTQGMEGAAQLAAQAALAAGAGKVFLLASSPRALMPARPEVMQLPAGWKCSPDTLARTTVVCGCGAGLSVGAMLPPLISHAARLVLDADALNGVATDTALAALVAARAGRGQHTILTPHPLEAARLLSCSTAHIQANRIHAATQLAAKFGCIAVLKGSGTVVAGPGDTWRINPSGNALLATGGSGDVLAGWLGGLWARQPTAAPEELASAAVWQHGLAADDAAANQPQWPSLRGLDLIEALRNLKC